MSTRKRWEYEICQVGGEHLFLDEQDMDMMNEMGSAGWEFVRFALAVEGWQVALFKREIIDE